MQFITRPLEKWPRPLTRNRRNSPYSVGYNRSLEDLEREVRHLGVKGDVVIQIDIPEEQISSKGLPYADARPRSPCVGVYFNCRHGPLTYYADAFTHWQANVRAIALGLQRLRLVEETGIISRGEQYTGFKALPGGIEVGPATMTVEEAARFISFEATGQTVHANTIVATHEGFDYSYRITAKKLHPDAAGGGDRAKWDQLQAAAAVLENYFKAKAGA